MRGQIVHIIYHTHLEKGVHFNFLPTYKKRLQNRATLETCKSSQMFSTSASIIAGFGQHTIVQIEREGFFEV